MKPLLLSFSLILAASLSAQTLLDTGFGFNGVRNIDFGGMIVGGGALLQPDGKLLLGGAYREGFDSGYILMRYFPDGGIDSTFGYAGIMKYEPGYDAPLALQEDGKILIADSYQISRFLPDGQPDFDFGDWGNAHFDFSNILWIIWPKVLAVQADGKILLAGGANMQYEDYSSFFVIRFLPSGEPDVSFGQEGVVWTEDLNLVNDLAIQADGKILAATSYELNMIGALARLNEDGSFDDGFGTGGVVVSNPETLLNSGRSVHFFQDGKILLACAKHLARFDPDGAPDPSFGDGGTADLGLSGWFSTLSAALTADDHILVTYKHADDIRVRRFLPDGAPDDSFGEDGKTDLDLWQKDFPTSVLALPDGSIAVAGVSDEKLSLAKLQPDGTPDEDFGDMGVRITYFGGYRASLKSVAEQSNGRLVAVGSARLGDIVLAGLLPDGKFDPTFGQEGRVVIDKKEFNLSATAMVLLPDDKIVAAGWNFLMRFLPDGEPDPSFGEAGLLQLAPGQVGINALALQPDGKFVWAGRIAGQAAVGRLLPNGEPDTSFGDQGWIGVGGGNNALFRDVLVQADGKIAAFGFFPDGYNLFRFSADGQPDLSFNFIGKVKTGLVAANALLVSPDGKIVVGGRKSNGNPGLVRILPSGAIDPGFSFSNSLANFPWGNYGAISDIAIQANGKILYMGTENELEVIFIGRTLPDGSADSTFFFQGHTRFPIPTGHTEASCLLVQADGKPVFAGTYFNPVYQVTSTADSDFLLIRATTDPSVGAFEPPANRLALRLTPNPVASQALLSYELAQTETVTILLHDASGKQIHTFVNSEKRPAGAQSEIIALPPGLPQGAYVLTLKTTSGAGSVALLK
jgi:uncharacterized delta-60 repeat protein